MSMFGGVSQAMKDKGIHVIPTQWVDLNRDDEKRPDCGKEFKRWDPTIPGTFASMGPFECVMFSLSNALMWKPGASGATTRRSCSWMFRGHIVKLKRPVRWRLSCHVKNR